MCLYIHQNSDCFQAIPSDMPAETYAKTYFQSQSFSLLYLITTIMFIIKICTGALVFEYEGIDAFILMTYV